MQREGFVARSPGRGFGFIFAFLRLCLGAGCDEHCVGCPWLVSSAHHHISFLEITCNSEMELHLGCFGWNCLSKAKQCFLTAPIEVHEHLCCTQSINKGQGYPKCAFSVPKPQHCGSLGISFLHEDYEEIPLAQCHCQFSHDKLFSNFWQQGSGKPRSCFVLPRCIVYLKIFNSGCRC